MSSSRRIWTPGWAEKGWRASEAEWAREHAEWAREHAGCECAEFEGEGNGGIWKSGSQERKPENTGGDFGRKKTGAHEERRFGE